MGNWIHPKTNSQRKRTPLKRKPCKITNNVVSNVSRINSFTWQESVVISPQRKEIACGMQSVHLVRQCYGKHETTTTWTEINVTSWINGICAFWEFHNIPAVFSHERSLASFGRLLCLTLTSVAGRPEAELVYGNGKLVLERKHQATKGLEEGTICP